MRVAKDVKVAALAHVAREKPEEFAEKEKQPETIAGQEPGKKTEPEPGVGEIEIL
jgi:hypothetical protein